MSRGQMCLVVSAIAAAAVACGDNQRTALAEAGAAPMRRPEGAPSAAWADATAGPTTATGSGGTAGAGNTAGSGAVGPFTFTPGPCADVFSDDQLTTYELQIDATEWAALVDDFYIDAGEPHRHLDYHPYHQRRRVQVRRRGPPPTR